MFDTILVCSDGSDHALNAAQTAAEIAARFSSRVILINVFTEQAESVLFGIELIPVYRGTPIGPVEQTQDTVEEGTGKVFERAGIKYDSVREQGHAVQKIIEVADQEKAGLIVMGSRGLGGFQRFFLGSISDGVLHHAQCPVLIVR